MVTKSILQNHQFHNIIQSLELLMVLRIIRILIMEILPIKVCHIRNLILMNNNNNRMMLSVNLVNVIDRILFNSIIA